MEADRTLPYSDERYISNIEYANGLIGYDPKLGNQTQLDNIGDVDGLEKPQALSNIYLGI
jgi:hypothetical protein